MHWILRASLAVPLLIALCRMVPGQPATVEGHVECDDEDCSIQDLRVNGEIVTETANAIQSLISEVHQRAEQQKKEVGGYSQLRLNSQGGSVSAAMAIGRLARREGLKITVAYPDVCLSACVLILAGGIVRYFSDKYTDRTLRFRLNK